MSLIYLSMRDHDPKRRSAPAHGWGEQAGVEAKFHRGQERGHAMSTREKFCRERDIADVQRRQAAWLS